MKRWKKIVLYPSGSLLLIIIIACVIFNQFFFLLLSGVGSQMMWYGKNDLGNKVALYSISKIKKKTANLYRGYSVQNTKNGNYHEAISALEKAMMIDNKEVSAYYGWVLLYYYRDYTKALNILELCDQFTPNFSDTPVGENIHYLKGLAQMQLQEYEKAVEQFNIYILETTSNVGEDWVDVYTFVNKGRSLAQLNKHQEAILTYDKAIKHYSNCTEAYYWKGISLSQIQKPQLACDNLQHALDLIQKGYKSSNAYVELFHEIYKQDISMQIALHCTP